VRDVALDDLGGARRRLVTPQRVDQAIGRDHFATVDEQQRQQRSLLGTAERDQPLLVEHFKRPKDSECDHDLAPGANVPPRARPDRRANTGL
jgi:hypothetical protein